MNRKIMFLATTSLILGSFLGTYCAKKSPTASYKLVEADKVIASGTSDTKKLAEATDLINEVISLEPDNPKALMIKALTLQRRGLTDDAIAVYEKLNESAESLSQFGHFNVGVLYQIKNDLPRAEVNYRIAVSIKDGLPMFWSNLIKLLVQTNRKAEAKEVLEDAVTIFPAAPEFKEFSYLKGQ